MVGAHALVGVDVGSVAEFVAVVKVGGKKAAQVFGGRGREGCSVVP